MKSTGIVRRIDELGRIVIPKEMRRTLSIKVGDSLEIFADGEQLVLKKYQEILKIEKFAQTLCDSVSEATGYMVLICDSRKVICENAYGNSYLGAIVSEGVAKAIEERKHIASGDAIASDAILIGESFESASMHTVIANGEAPGGVIVCSLSAEDDKKIDEICKMCAVYLGKNLG
ncbi:MAG: stage V sporulation T C-terminal domain-containing protein [Bacillota bacterium]